MIRNQSNYLDPKLFKIDLQGKSTDLFMLTNDAGMEVWITNYGARVVAMRIPNHDGSKIDVVLGFDSIQKYFEADEQYHGAVVGRYANRIANGSFSMSNKTYNLPVNNGPNCLHGGVEGFDKKVWNVHYSQKNALVMSYYSKEGEEGFPGNLHVTCTYTLSEDNALKIEFSGTCDQPTVINLTHHNYFNLKGEGQGTAMDHELLLLSSAYTPISQFSIPNEGIVSIPKGHIFDFSTFKSLGQDIDANHIQLQNAAGYDHNFVIDGYEAESRTPRLAAKIKAPNGLQLSILSNEPGLQLYTANFLSGKDIGKCGNNYGRREAFCLEQQHFPDSPNQSAFPSTVVLPGEQYYSVCIQSFEWV